MASYSNDLKQTMVAKICSPGGPSAFQLSKETGISPVTLTNWVKKYGDVTFLKTKITNTFSPLEKFKILSETENFPEQELGEYLRKNGLYSSQLKEWKGEVLNALTDKPPGRPKKDPELAKKDNQIKKLRKDLNRKERALAEQTALVILQKKAQALWGENEEENSP